jgi:transcriptional regulator with XRE-family HTH domain
MPDANPTARQRELSRQLRMLREEKGLTATEVAEQLLFSPTKLSRIETAKRKATLRDVRDLCQLYGVNEPETAQLMDLARGARENGWWARYEDLGVGPYLGLEQEARSITYYSMSFVNGLLQSDGYARAIIRATHPQMEDQVLKERVEARLRRQDLLEGTDRPRLRVLLDEAVLRRQVGGSKVMAGQLSKILDITAKEKAVVQIVPFSSEVQPGNESNFTFFEFGDSSQPVLHIEGLLSSLIHDRPTIIERYREVLDNLRDAALSPRDSQNLITVIRDEHSAHP